MPLWPLPIRRAKSPTLTTSSAPYPGTRARNCSARTIESLTPITTPRILSATFGRPSHKDKLNEEGKRGLAIIQSETQRMGRLIDELLNFSRLGRQQMKLSPLDMAAFGRTVLDELTAHQLQRPPEVEFITLPPARGDQ